MIKTKELTKYFDDFLAVDHVNLDVKAGEILVLLGPNGAGKTTTVRMISSILSPSGGSAWVAGYDVVNEAQKVRASIGVLTEHHGLYKRMNAYEYLGFYAKLYNMDERNTDRRIHSLLEEFGLSAAGKKRLGEYSKGMRQKLALVRAIMHEPKVLLLDEPTSAMDPESARMVRNAITRISHKDRTILLCTHNLIEAEELADKVAIIRQGKIILSDQIDSLKRQVLGEKIFQAKFNQSIEKVSLDLLENTKLLKLENKIAEFQIKDHEKVNPILIKKLLSQNLDLISFQEKEFSLEDVYMQIVKNDREVEI
ncbi:MAG: ABC transporter ATP-binding protein [Anaerolineaceae bacterium]|nr:ABC transporter ATP-binding protein [Anaerolineaceae bacterium]